MKRSKKRFPSERLSVPSAPPTAGGRNSEDLGETFGSLAAEAARKGKSAKEVQEVSRSASDTAPTPTQSHPDAGLVGKKIQRKPPTEPVVPQAPISNSRTSLKNRKSSDVIIVLGMHRSGTSAVSGTLMKLGGAPPKHFMAADAGNARGYFESVAFMHFHDELLASAGSHWRDWRLFNPGWYSSPVAGGYMQRAKELFEAEFDGSALPVFKDPRICRFLPFWLDVLREMQKAPRIVMPIRSPLEVAHSLKNGHGLPLAEGLLLWLRHVLDAEMQSRAETRSIFTWNEFQSDWRGVCGKISTDTGLSWPRLSDRASREIDSFLTKELVHHETDYAELAAHSDVHEWTLRAYDSLLELARDPSSNAALDTLDQVRALLEQSSKMFGRLLVDYELNLEDLRSHSRALTSERDLLLVHEKKILAENAAAMAGLTARAHEVGKALSEAGRDKEALSQALAASVVERDALREERARFAAELQSRQQEVMEGAAALADLSVLARDADALRSEREALRKRVAELADDRSQLRNEAENTVAALKDELERAFAMLSAERQRAAEQSDRLGDFEARQNSLLAELAASAERVHAATEESTRDKEALSAAIEASLAERARLAAELNSKLRQLAASETALAEFVARDEQAEKALDEAEHALEEAARDKELQSRALAAAQRSLAELTEVLRQLEAEASAANSMLGEASGRNLELARTLREVRSDKAAAVQQLTMRSSDIDAMNAVRIDAERRAQDLICELESAERQERELRSKLSEMSMSLEQSNAALGVADSNRARVEAELADAKRALREVAQQQAAQTDLQTRLDREIQEKHVLAVDRERTSSELQRVQQVWRDRVATEAAAHAKAVAEAQKVHEAQLQALSGQLIDAEAALTHATATHLRAGLLARVLPASFQRRLLARRLVRSGLFDVSWYVATYSDVAESELGPAEHYLEIGFCRGYRPNPFFDTRLYLERHEDVRRSGVNPLLHYLVNGWREGRDPGPGFHTDYYLEVNPDVRAIGMNPLLHYLRYGRHEGRLPMRPM